MAYRTLSSERPDRATSAIVLVTIVTGSPSLVVISVGVMRLV
jgi:hypothetical protein